MKKSVMMAAACAMSFLMAVPALAARADRRMRRQEARIEHGEKSGQLTPKEANRLERKEGALQEKIREERAANGGRLTPAERRQVNRQQNRLSREIIREKHDGQTQPGVAPAPAAK